MKNYIRFSIIVTLVAFVLSSTSAFATSNQYCAAVEETWEVAREVTEKAVEKAWAEAWVGAVEAKKTWEALEEAGVIDVEALVTAVESLETMEALVAGENEGNEGLLGDLAAFHATNKTLQGLEERLENVDKATLEAAWEAAESLETWESLVVAVEALDTVEDGAVEAAVNANFDAGEAATEYISTVFEDLISAVESVEETEENVKAIWDAVEAMAAAMDVFWEVDEEAWGEVSLEAKEAWVAAVEAGEPWDAAVEAGEAVLKAYCLLSPGQGNEKTTDNSDPMIVMPEEVEINSTVYLLGNDAFSCRDFEARESAYLYQFHDPDPDMDVILKYTICLLAKGQVIGDRGLVDKGLYILHELDLDPSYEDTSFIVANFIRAIYFATGGDFSIYGDQNLVIATEYFSRVLGLIKALDSIAELDYPYNPHGGSWEEDFQIELDTYYQLPRLYLEMSYYGVKGYHHQNVLHSPSYEGDRDLETYPDYRDNVMDYIDLALKTASDCKNLPMKKHFYSDFYSTVIQACTSFYESAELLKDNQWKRQVLFSLDRCKDVGSERMIRANCPELDKLDDEFDRIYSGDYLAPWY